MTFQEFLDKAHDSSIDADRLARHFREAMHHNLSYDNLDEAEKSFVFDIILKYRTKLFKHERVAGVDLEHAYYRIWEKRHALGLEENDLDKIKEIIYSFKSK